MSINWLIIFLGLGAILLELFIGIEAGFDLVLIGIALIIGGGVGNLTDNMMLGIAITGMLSAAYIFFGRQFVKSKLRARSNKTNIEFIIGKKGRVEKSITPTKAGQVKIGPEVWRATADHKIVEGSKITVQSINGVTAHVVEYNK